MKVLTVSIVLKDGETHYTARKEMDGYDMCFTDKDINKAYEVFFKIKRFMQKEQWRRERDEKEVK